MAEMLKEDARRPLVLFHKHPQQLGEQISQLLIEHPEVDLADCRTLDEFGTKVGVIFDVWVQMDLQHKPPYERPET